MGWRVSFDAGVAAQKEVNVLRKQLGNANAAKIKAEIAYHQKESGKVRERRGFDIRSSIAE